MDILSRYCLNDRPVPFRVLSDQGAFTAGCAPGPSGGAAIPAEPGGDGAMK